MSEKVVVKCSFCKEPKTNNVLGRGLCRKHYYKYLQTVTALFGLWRLKKW